MSSYKDAKSQCNSLPARHRVHTTAIMHNPNLVLFAVASAIGGAVAQFDSSVPTSTGFTVDHCIYGCISQAASSAGCLGLGDSQCICGSSTYQDSANSCLQQCTKADADWGKAWYQDTCEYVSTLEGIISDFSTYSSGIATVSVSNSAQLSSLEVEASTFAAHLSSEFSVATASYSSAYALLSSSASVLLTAASETALSTSAASSSTASSHSTSSPTSPSSTHSTSGTTSTTGGTTTSNAASGLRVNFGMMQGGVIACATAVLGLLLGSAVALV